jgi:integrase
LSNLFDFEAWMLSSKGWAAATVDRYLVQLLAAQRDYGLDLGRFTLAGAQAYYTQRRRGGATALGSYADYKALNAYAEFLFGERPFKKPQLPRGPQVLGLGADEVRRVLSYRHPHPATSRLFRAVVFTELTLGWRPSELARLRVHDLDPKASRVHCAFPAKGGRRRWVPVPRSTWSPKRPLMAYLARRPEHPSGWLFINTLSRPHTEHGRPVTPEYLERVMRRVSLETGVHLNHNLCRHTVAVRLRRNDFDPLDIRDYLGHTKVQETYLEDPHSLEDRMRRRPPKDFYQGGL